MDKYLPLLVSYHLLAVDESEAQDHLQVNSPPPWIIGSNKGWCR